MFNQKEETKNQEEVKENNAFIMMRTNDNPDVQEVKRAIVETCKRFEIEATTVDGIEHQEKISDVIIKEIKTCKYLIADLTGERPNVYYEVGYAHALERSPGVILLKKKGGKAHFDISHHKISEYKNIQSLKTILTKRLGDITGKKPVK